MRYMMCIVRTGWVNLTVTICLVLGTSAMVITNWEVEKLSKQLHDLAGKERIDLDCDICEITVKAIQLLGRLNTSEDEVASAITKLVCPLLNKTQTIEYFICEQIIQEYKSEVFYVFTGIALGPNEICGFLSDGGCGDPYNPWKQNWTVTFPDVPKPPPSNQSVPKPDVPLIKILHLSDVHIDLEYTEGLNANCEDPLCCRPPNSPPSHGQSKQPAGHWGEFKCDLPFETFNNLLEHLAQNKKEFDWIYWTGDLPAHDDWNQTRSDQQLLLQLLTKQMEFYLGDVKIYPTLGNHESAPVNSFPPPWITGKNSNQWLLDSYQVDFSHWLPSSTSSTIKRGGFYAVKVAPGLKLISLNMNYCNNGNWWLLINSIDPAGQLQWMIDELQASEDAKEKVHIIGHIAPGLNNCMAVWSWNYNRIVNRYEDTIVGQFFGHTHQDEFEIFYDNDDSSRAINVAYLGPSVTPYQYNNPAYRIYEMDGIHTNTTFQLVDHHNYFFNLTVANSESIMPTWEYLYSAKESYGLKSLQPQEWSDLVDRMETNDTLFERFLEYYYRRSISDIDCNVVDCKRMTLLCALKTSQSHNTSHCHNITDIEFYHHYYTYKNC